MGKYINVNSKGKSLPALGKAKALLEDGAMIVAPEFQENLICVVSNGPFDAAGYMYNKDEFDSFNYPGDHRPKVWLTHPMAKELAR